MKTNVYLFLFFTIFKTLSLSGCKHVSSDGDSGLQSMSSHSDDLRNAVIRELEKKNSATKGSLWSPGNGNLPTNWVVQSPEGYWGKSIDELPIGFECPPGSAGCDSVFPRKLCSTDDDCASSRTRCKILEASASPIMKARAMCVGSGDSLLDRFYSVMVGTQKHLDITSLAAPDGAFRSAFTNALAILHERANPPTVRILLSGEKVVALNTVNRAQQALERIWAETGIAAGDPEGFAAELAGKKVKMKMNLGYVAFASGMGALPDILKLNFTSWNHSKIIISDSSRFIQGGHNMWSSAYSSPEPVSDLSMEVSGSIATGTQAYVNALWSKVKSENFFTKHTTHLYGEIPNRSFLSSESYRIPNPNLQPATAGTIPMIAVGRMGALGANPSDDALNALIEASTDRLDFVVQDMYGLISNVSQFFPDVVSGIVSQRTWVFDALARASLRGVKIRVVQSDTKIGVNDYTLSRYTTTYDLLIKDLIAFAKRSNFKTPSGQSLREYFCQAVEYAPYRYSATDDSWKAGGGFASHAKMLIVDDSAFYIGSQNFYVSNLQEFGLIVADQAATKQLQKKNWDLIWNASQPSKAACPNI